jgi:hypothetical protein
MMPRIGRNGTPFLRGDEAGMDGGTGGVHEPEGGLAHALGEPRRAAGLAQGDGAGLEHADEAFADQHVALHTGDRHADEMQVHRPVGDDRCGRRHGDAAIIGGHREAHPRTHLRGQRLERNDLSHRSQP